MISLIWRFVGNDDRGKTGQPLSSPTGGLGAEGLCLLCLATGGGREEIRRSLGEANVDQS